MDISKLKVADLRRELQSRGLETKGNKPVLIERLKEAIEKEKAEEEEEEESENEEESPSGSEEENSLTYETAESTNNTVREAEPETETAPISAEERAFSVITSTASMQNNLSDDADSRSSRLSEEKQTTKLEPELEETSPPRDEPIPEVPEDETPVQPDTETFERIEESPENLSEEAAAESEYLSPQHEPIAATNEVETIEDKELEYSLSPKHFEPEETSKEETDKAERMDFEEPSEEVKEPQPISNGDSFVQREFDEGEKTLPFPDTTDETEFFADNEPQTIDEPSKNDELDKTDEQPTQADESIAAEPAVIYDENEKTLPFVDETEKMETESIPVADKNEAEAESETTNEKGEEANQEGESLWNSDDESQAAPITEPPPETTAEEPRKRIRKSRFDQPEERKRKHSPSPTGDGSQSGGYYEAPAKIPKQDDEPSYDQDSVLLSWYDSDLNLVISKENFISAVPLCDQGFMYMWGGVRSTYGFNSGKVYYDVKLTEKCSVNVYDEFEIYSFRLGWSVAYSSLQLGETALSYGFDSSGKKCTDDKFEEYAKTFGVDDVIGCLLDFESNEENVIITFAVNGDRQDAAFEVPKSSLEDKALFPHVLSKNIKFEVNFGDRIESWNADESFKEEFEWAAKVPLEQRVQGPKKADEKTECEVIMMCGLPCSGKTTWVKNHVESHPQKMYNVIGIEAVLNKMKVIAEPIQNHYKDAPDILVEKCTRCMNRLIDLASVRWRNYILDQPNVFATVQRRKMRNFEGYTRIAIVIIPVEEEYERMLEKWNDNTLRDTSIPLLELKDNFKLPEEGELFNNVSFVGVNKEEAEEIVKKYNKEGRDARARDERPYNRGFGGRDHGDRPQSYGRPPMSGYRPRWTDRGPPPSMGRGGWAPRGGMDRMPPGFRERRGWRDRSPDDDRESSYRGGRYQQRGMPGSRYGSGGPMMNDNRSWGRGRDRDRMTPRMGGPPGGPNPLMGQMMGKPMMGYSNDRKGRYGSDDGKRRDDGDSDDYERSRVNPPGVDEDIEEPFDDGSGGEDGDRKRRSRFSDSDRKDQGYRGGRGGFQGRGGNNGRGGRGGNGRPGPFPPGKGPRGGGYSNRGRGPEGNNDYYGGRGGGGGGGPPRRDNRDRNQMGPRQGSSRFDKRDSGGKNDGNSQVSQPPPSWGMYGQGSWNQSAANYQNWAQYQQQAGYSAQQMQQYWSQVQQQQQNQQGQQNQQSQQQSGQQNSKNANSGTSANASSTSTTTSQSASNSSSQQSSGTSSGYNTQGYNTAGYGAQGYDANAYAQYCAQYYSQLAQQGWTTQNAWAAYGYNYGAMAASAGGVGGLPSTSVPPPSVTGGASGSSTGGSGNQSSAVTSASNK